MERLGEFLVASLCTGSGPRTPTVFGCKREYRPFFPTYIRRWEKSHNPPKYNHDLPPQPPHKSKVSDYHKSLPTVDRSCCSDKAAHHNNWRLSCWQHST